MHLYCTTNRGKKQPPPPTKKQTENHSLLGRNNLHFLTAALCIERKENRSKWEERAESQHGLGAAGCCSGQKEQPCWVRSLQCLYGCPCNRNVASSQCILLWWSSCSILMWEMLFKLLTRHQFCFLEWKTPQFLPRNDLQSSKKPIVLALLNLKSTSSECQEPLWKCLWNSKLSGILWKATA